MSMHGSRDFDLTHMRRERRKDRHVDKTGIRWSGLSAGETAAPQKLGMFVI